MCNLSLTIVGEGRSLASTVWITVLAFLRYLYVEICTLLSAWVFVGFTPAGFFCFFFPPLSFRFLYSEVGGETHNPGWNFFKGLQEGLDLRCGRN